MICRHVRIGCCPRCLAASSLSLPEARDLGFSSPTGRRDAMLWRCRPARVPQGVAMFPQNHQRLLLLVALSLTSWLGPASAQWRLDGAPVCTAANSQRDPTIVSDGAGGAIFAWQDDRNGNFDIYAQHVLSTGAVDPAWPADGRTLCTAAGDQFTPKIVADGTTSPSQIPRPHRSNYSTWPAAASPSARWARSAPGGMRSTSPPPRASRPGSIWSCSRRAPACA